MANKKKEVYRSGYLPWGKITALSEAQKKAEIETFQYPPGEGSDTLFQAVSKAIRCENPASLFIID